MNMKALIVIMGIDLESWSNVVIMPIPQKYIAKVIPRKPIATNEIMSGNDTKKEKQGRFSLLMAMTGGDRNYLDNDFGSNGKLPNNISIPPRTEISSESYAWKEDQMHCGLIYVDWELSQAYYKTDTSEQFDFSASYSGLSSFCKSLTELSDGSCKFYFPYDGILDTKICNKYLNFMLEIWPQWQHLYAPNIRDSLYVLVDKEIKKIKKMSDKEKFNRAFECDNYELYRYIDLYINLKYAADRGFLQCY